MRRFFKIATLIGCFVLLFSACERQIDEPVYMGYEYFPFTQGTWKIFDVDSTLYDDFLNQVFHYQYQVLEKNSIWFEDAAGDSALFIESYWRWDDQDTWKRRNNVIERFRDNKALRTQENITHAKLVFPVRRNQSWNGNAYNNNPVHAYRVTGLDEPLHVGGTFYDATLTVLHQDFVTLISEEYQYEIYAKGVGLIERHFTEVKKEIDGTIIQGVRYSRLLREYSE